METKARDDSREKAESAEIGLALQLCTYVVSMLLPLTRWQGVAHSVRPRSEQRLHTQCSEIEWSLEYQNREVDWVTKHLVGG